MERLGQEFFCTNTVEVAQSLIGCILARRFGEEIAAAVITETEAYRGADDPASHAHRGQTPRNRIMFGEAGRLYVYFSYGMHHCMNVVTEEEGQPGAVLLRAAVPLQGQTHFRANRPNAPEKQWMNGPGKLTAAFGINLTANGLDLADPGQEELMILPGASLPWTATPRIGISKGVELPWRFAALPAAAADLAAAGRTFQ
ncbi:DNA-3-methyladenine glycosylase [Paenibacillus sp. YN15]|uniref:DNA-3-methyladenine glycosylase n=1 Tax=Paenibacillus sp. YN15 TaxID=1742774 RepID=UPI000DCF5383|nr:DNA-3-methyladenine glycosylase [Paenibacillus sp. YN15]RAU97669.1 DNA-3-methyladenine glycosylase [Paenibacillus sp. YN15]